MWGSKVHHDIEGSTAKSWKQSKAAGTNRYDDNSAIDKNEWEVSVRQQLQILANLVKSALSQTVLIYPDDRRRHHNEVLSASKYTDSKDYSATKDVWEIPMKSKSKLRGTSSNISVSAPTRFNIDQQKDIAGLFFSLLGWLSNFLPNYIRPSCDAETQDSDCLNTLPFGNFPRRSVIKPCLSDAIKPSITDSCCSVIKPCLYDAIKSSITEREENETFSGLATVKGVLKIPAEPGPRGITSKIRVDALARLNNLQLSPEKSTAASIDTSLLEPTSSWACKLAFTIHHRCQRQGLKLHTFRFWREANRAAVTS